MYHVYLCAVFHSVLQTQEEQESLNASIDKQQTEAQWQQDYLDSEHKRLRQVSDRLEADKARARTEQRLQQESSEMERARLEAEHERQLMEWAEVEKERRHQLTLRQYDNIAAQQHLVIVTVIVLPKFTPQVRDVAWRKK